MSKDTSKNTDGTSSDLKQAVQFMNADLKRSGLTTNDLLCLPATGKDSLNMLYPGKPKPRSVPPVGYAILAPHVDGSGDIVTLPKEDRFRIRFKEPWSPDGKDNSKYRTPAGSRYAVTFGTDNLLNPDATIYIVEGEKKAAKLFKELIKSGRTNTVAIAICGVEMGVKDGLLVSDLRKLPLAGRDVHIVFDSDKQTNPNVQDAERRLADALIKAKAIPFSIDIPAINSFDKTGVDDYLKHCRGDKRFVKLPRTGLLMPESITAADLLKQKIPDPYAVIPGLLLEGLTLLAGNPKAGKSWAVLDIAISVASGTKAFGHFAVDRSDVLYLALEDSDKRLQNRIAKLSHAGGRDISRLHLQTNWPTLDTNCIPALEAHLKKYPDTKLIIIDVLEKIRGQRAAAESVYSHEYKTVEPLAKFARQHNLALVVVHHTRKARDAEDQLNDISGTTGLTGAADSIFVLRKAGMNNQLDENIRTIYARGRDIDESDFALTLDFENGRGWKYLGDTAHVLVNDTRKQIFAAMEGTGSEKRMKPKEIEEASGISNKNHKLANMLRRMKSDGLLEGSGLDGYYVAPPSDQMKKIAATPGGNKGEAEG